VKDAFAKNFCRERFRWRRAAADVEMPAMPFALVKAVVEATAAARIYADRNYRIFCDAHHSGWSANG
jgi:hypothetical protein